MSDSWYTPSVPEAPYLNEAYPTTWASERSAYRRRYASPSFTESASARPLTSTILPRGRSRTAAMSRGLNGSALSSAAATRLQYPTPIEVTRNASAMTSVSRRMLLAIVR